MNAAVDDRSESDFIVVVKKVHLFMQLKIQPKNSPMNY